MVFVFGTTERQKPRGWVVDRCPSCLDLRWFQLLDHRQTWHLYFVPLGKGRFLYSTQRCSKCGSDFPLQHDEYVTTLPESARHELDVEEGLRRTQPELAKRFDEIDELAARARRAYRDANDASGEELLGQAAERLRVLERRGVDSERFLARLRGFTRLSASERELLFAELKGFHDALVT
jgi:hypothetical protein